MLNLLSLHGGSLTSLIHHHRETNKSILKLELFLRKKQMSPPERNQNITKFHLVILQWEWLKIIHAKVIVLVYDTSSECALQMYDVLLKYR